MTPPRSSALSEARRAQLEALVARWREHGAYYDTFHATMGCGWKTCATELDALLRAEASPPAALPAETPSEAMVRYYMQEAFKAGHLAAQDQTDKYGETHETPDEAFAAWLKQPASPAETPRAETCATWQWYANRADGGTDYRCLRCRRVTTFFGIGKLWCPACDKQPPQASRAVEGDETL